MKLIILDRDGVINYDSFDYIKSPMEWRAIPGSLQAIADLNKAGYKIAVVTNQSGIGRGFYTEETLASIHKKMHAQLAEVNGVIDKIVYCPHLPTVGCHCRKPKPGMLLDIAEYYATPLDDIWMIGDRISDTEAAKNAGAKPAIVKTGLSAEWRELIDVPVYDDLQHFAEDLLR